MATYDTVKTLKKAKSLKNRETNNVISWELVVEYKHTAENGDQWSRDYPVSLDVESLDKQHDQFTAEEILQLVEETSSKQHVFDSHYEHFIQGANSTTERTLQVLV